MFHIILYFIGCILFSLGAKFFISSNLGTDPLDVLLIGMTHHLPINIGTASAILSIFFLSIWCIWNKKFPPITPFITTTMVGYFIDFWNYINLQNILQFNPYFYLLCGVLLCAYASSLIIISKIGIRIMDLMVLTFSNKLGWSFTFGKLLIEIFLFTVGIILGGPFGMGTICFLLFVGILIEPFINMNTKIYEKMCT